MALDNARRDKYYADEQRLEYARKKKRYDAFMSPWNAAQMLDYICHRAKWDVHMRFHMEDSNDGRPEFVIDDQNVDVINALCLYFTNDPRFELLHMRLGDGVTRPCGYKLSKGILLGGPKGTGKTSIMRLFNRNKRYCYELFDCREVAAKFSKPGDAGGYKAIELLEGMLIMPKCEANFHNEKFGVCFEDLGTEEEAAWYGNKVNVLAHLLQGRYSNNIPFYMTHMTTNLAPAQIKTVYGERVYDRMKEMFNWMQIDGESRR